MAKKKAARRPAPRKPAAARRAKRKPARQARRRTAVRASGRAAKAKASARRVKKTPAGRATKATPGRPAPRSGSATAPAGRRPTAAVKETTLRKAGAKKAQARTKARRAAAGAARPTTRVAVKPKAAVPKKRVATSVAMPAVPAPKAAAPNAAVPARRSPSRPSRPQRGPAPGLNRERRTIADDDVISAPSSFGFEPRASSAHSGGRELHEKYVNHPGDAGPGITGGDIDADWESAYSVGDEAPGGDNPTPDQDRVDDIGRALGVQYEDDEELEGEHKISERDRHRWEYDPASSDDWKDRED